jgi:hypothetical protein
MLSPAYQYSVVLGIFSFKFRPELDPGVRIRQYMSGFATRHIKVKFCPTLTVGFLGETSTRTALVPPVTQKEDLIL